jgi:hypothetical protein
LNKEKNMAGFNMSEWIARPPKEVFDFISASENAPKIVDSVTGMVKLTEGPARVGTRYRETRLMHGREQQAELEIVEFEPAQRYAMQNVTEGVEIVYRYNFQPERDGTRIDLVCELKTKGMKKLMLPLIASVLKKEDGGHLQRVKQILEE